VKKHTRRSIGCREKLFAIGDDFWIENESGERAFKVNGKVLRVRDTSRTRVSRGRGGVFRSRKRNSG
jgi:uncharacterized protein YxjI